LLNAKVELNRITAEYNEKVKAESDQFTALSNQYDTEAQVNKLKINMLITVFVMTYIISEQLKMDILTVLYKLELVKLLKKNTPIAVMPSEYDIAVETYVNPLDLPLISKGAKIRIWFDGWPTIVFSGWPDMSYGTFGGRIVAVEKFISDNGKFRVLCPDPNEDPWPKQLSIGSGAQTIALLNTVPVWFEIYT
jgi:hypothetical protein